MHYHPFMTYMWFYSTRAAYGLYFAYAEIQSKDDILFDGNPWMNVPLLVSPFLSLFKWCVMCPNMVWAGSALHETATREWSSITTKVIKTWPRGGRYIYMEYGYGEGELVCGATSDSSPVCEDGVVKHWVWIQIKLFIVQHNKKRNLSWHLIS